MVPLLLAQDYNHPFLVCFDDYKTYVVICTNPVCVLVCFRILICHGVFFPKGRLIWLKSAQIGFKAQDSQDHI